MNDPIVRLGELGSRLMQLFEVIEASLNPDADQPRIEFALVIRREAGDELRVDCLGSPPAEDLQAIPATVIAGMQQRLPVEALQ